MPGIEFSEWVLTESPYAEYEEGMDGESHPRYVCKECRGEAGWDRDPDGFANYQDKTPFCPHCGRRMKNERK